jgi:hypothetical protein
LRPLRHAVLLIGVQGAGKTTFYLQRFSGTHAHISLDVLGSRERERRVFCEAVGARSPLVVDNTNATRVERERYLSELLSAHYDVEAFFFPLELRAAIARNGRRTDKKPVPVPALIRTWKRLEPPSGEEGFVAIRQVRALADGEFEVR